MSSIKATIKSHKATKDSWGVAWADLEDPGADPPSGVGAGSDVQVVGGQIALAAPGETLQLEGEWEHSARWGLRFQVQVQISQGVTSPEGLRRWLERLDGVGPKLAEALWKAHGEGLVAVLKGEVEADLTLVSGIGADREKLIRESFLELEAGGDLETIQFLERIGASRWEQGKIAGFCKAGKLDARHLLETAPYKLTTVKGLGFLRVDKLARHAGVSREAPGRIEAGTRHMLGDLVQAGSTAIRLGRLARQAAGDLLGVDSTLVMDAIRRLEASGDVVIERDDQGVSWVHPRELIEAERVIFAAAVGAEGRAPGGYREVAQELARDPGEAVAEAVMDANTALQLAQESAPGVTELMGDCGWQDSKEGSW